METRVASLIFMTNKEIALTLKVSRRSVEHIVEKLLKKYQVTNRTALIQPLAAAGLQFDWDMLQTYSDERGYL